MDNRIVFVTAKSENGQDYAKPRVVSLTEAYIVEVIPSKSGGLTVVKTKGVGGVRKDYKVYESPLEIEVARNPLSTDLYVKGKIAAAVSAAGSAQGTATAISAYFTEVTTVTAASAEGVILPAAVVGAVFTIQNNDASGDALKVYPATGGFIDNLAVNVNTTVAVRTRKTFVCLTTGRWTTADDFTQG